MARQGKCKACKIRVTWADRAPLPRVPCPRCGGALVATSRQSTLEVVDLACGGDATEGDCVSCGVRFSWDEKFPMRLARCPKCGRTLIAAVTGVKRARRDIGRLRPVGKLARLSIRPQSGQAYAWSDEEGQMIAVPWAWKKKIK